MHKDKKVKCMNNLAMLLLSGCDTAKLAATAETVKVIIHSTSGDFSRRLLKR